MRQRQNRIMVERCTCGNGRSWHWICRTVRHMPPRFWHLSICSGCCYDTHAEALAGACHHADVYNPFRPVQPG